MNTTPQQDGTETKVKKLPIDWAESEWFQVWLRLARRDYQGQPNLQKDFPGPVLAAA